MVSIITLTNRSQIDSHSASIEKKLGKPRMLEILKVQNVKKLKDISYFKSLTKIIYYPHCCCIKVESFEYEQHTTNRGVVLVEIVDLHSTERAKPIRWNRQGIDAIAAEENWELLSQFLYVDFRNNLIRHSRNSLVQKIKNKLNLQ
jgi:hypothetical protein